MRSILSVLFLFCCTIALAQDYNTKPYIVRHDIDGRRAVGTDTLDLTGKLIRVDHHLASAWSDDASIAIVCDTVDTFKRVTNFHIDIDEWDTDTADGEFTVPATGIYHAVCNLSLQSGTANRTAHVALFQGEDKQECCSAETTLPTPAIVQDLSFACYVSLTADQKVTLRVSSEIGTATFTINHMQLAMRFIK